MAGPKKKAAPEGSGPAKKAAPKKKTAAAGGAKSASKSRPKSASKTYTDPELREKLKAEITAGDKGGKPGQWSARKAQLLASEYKKAGGGYREDGKKSESQEHLDQWTDEHWKTKDGKPAIHPDGETSRYLPEKAWDELSEKETAATDEKKKAGSREGKQYVANTGPAKAARKKASPKPKPKGKAKPNSKSGSQSDS